MLCYRFLWASQSPKILHRVFVDQNKFCTYPWCWIKLGAISNIFGKRFPSSESLQLFWKFDPPEFVGKTWDLRIQSGNSFVHRSSCSLKNRINHLGFLLVDKFCKIHLVLFPQCDKLANFCHSIRQDQASSEKWI